MTTPFPPTVEPRPDAPTRSPNWALWFPLAAVFAGLAASLLVGGVLLGIVHATGSHAKADSPGMNIANTVLLDLFVVAACVVTASTAGRPRLWQFGLRRAALGTAIAASLVGLIVFFGFEGAYSSLVQSKNPQQIAKDLGADLSTLALIGGAIAVVAIAPVCEEIFFRGFLYRALRLRMPLWPAAIIDGVIFGAVHGSLVIMPVLAVLGLILCLVYERTGSIFPTIAMHSLNNMLAFGSTAKNGWPASLAVGAVVLLGCLVVPRLLSPAPRPAAA